MSSDTENQEKRMVFSKETLPVEEVPRTNTGVKIDNPEGMKEAGEKDEEEKER